MKPTYEDMIEFMRDYFKAYNNYAQNPGDGEEDVRLLHTGRSLCPLYVGLCRTGECDKESR